MKTSNDIIITKGKLPKTTHYILDAESIISVSELSKSIKEKAAKNQEDLYSYNGRIILINENTLESFLNFMFRQKICPRDAGFGPFVCAGTPNCENNAQLSWKPDTSPHKATVIFCSNTNKEKKRITGWSNNWAKRNNLPFYFDHLDGSNDGLNGASAQTYARMVINSHPNEHVVFFCGNMTDRSFSVTDIVNGIMMVTSPCYASALQKLSRLKTTEFLYDKNTIEEKFPRMYWFNFQAIDATISCPVFELLADDAKHYEGKKDQHGNELKTYAQTVDIYCVNDSGETSIRLTEQDIWKNINETRMSLNAIKVLCNDMDSEFGKQIDDVLEELSGWLNQLYAKYPEELNKYTVKSKTSQVNINPGKTFKSSKHSKQAEKSEKITMLDSKELFANVVYETVQKYQKNQNSEEECERKVPLLCVLMGRLQTSHIGQCILHSDIRNRFLALAFRAMQHLKVVPGNVSYDTKTVDSIL